MKKLSILMCALLLGACCLKPPVTIPADLMEPPQQLQILEDEGNQ